MERQGGLGLQRMAVEKIFGFKTIITNPVRLRKKEMVAKKVSGTDPLPGNQRRNASHSGGKNHHHRIPEDKRKKGTEYAPTKVTNSGTLSANQEGDPESKKKS